MQERVKGRQVLISRAPASADAAPKWFRQGSGMTILYSRRYGSVYREWIDSTVPPPVPPPLFSPYSIADQLDPERAGGGLFGNVHHDLQFAVPVAGRHDIAHGDKDGIAEQ